MQTQSLNSYFYLGEVQSINRVSPLFGVTTHTIFIPIKIYWIVFQFGREQKKMWSSVSLSIWFYLLAPTSFIIIDNAICDCHCITNPSMCANIYKTYISQHILTSAIALIIRHNNVLQNTSQIASRCSFCFFFFFVFFLQFLFFAFIYPHVYVLLRMYDGSSNSPSLTSIHISCCCLLRISLSLEICRFPSAGNHFQLLHHHHQCTLTLILSFYIYTNSDSFQCCHSKWILQAISLVVYPLLSQFAWQLKVKTMNKNDKKIGNCVCYRKMKATTKHQHR